jgi:aminomethyltransferase
MVDFAGWSMPVSYEGLISEHLAVRTAAGVFDVSHMGQLLVEGDDALGYLQQMLSNDLGRISAGHAQYTLLLDDNGCPIDDLIAYRMADDRLLLVVNASRVGDDHEWLAQHVPGGASVTDCSDRYAMLALQGATALDLVTLPELEPFAFAETEVCGVECFVARTGYTGEPGVEMMCGPDDAGRLWDALLEAGATPCGLGARDTLRLEVCYPLYGNDLSRDRTALEAGLGWVCALDAKEFTGAPSLRQQKAAGGYDRLVAFRMDGRGIPRQGMPIEPAGEVTSGTMSPSLKIGIGMGYVPAASAEPGTPIQIDVRGTAHPATVARKPLYVKEH